MSDLTDRTNIARALAGAAPEGVALTGDQARELNSRAKFFHPIPQFTGPEGERVGVWVRAWTWLDRVEAELEAILWATRRAGKNADPAAVEALIASRHILEEVARGLAEPVPTSVLERWNEAIIYDLHAAISALAPLPARVLDAELQRIAGGPPPAPPAPAADRPRAGGYVLPAQKPAPPAPAAVPEPAPVGDGDQHEPG